MAELSCLFHFEPCLSSSSYTSDLISFPPPLPPLFSFARMRRIASVLSQRHSDKPERRPPPDGPHPGPPSNPPLPKQPHRKPSRRFFTLSRISVSTDRPTRPSEPAHSSSASSTGSVSLRTPDDDRVAHLAPGRSPSGRRAWIPWLTPKKPEIQVQSQRPSSFWSDSLNLIPSPIALPTPSSGISGQPAEFDEDTSEESSSSESSAPSLSPPIPARTEVTRPLASVDFLKALTTNNIPPPFSAPPLLHYPNAPAFPRSSNRPRSLPFHDTMESTMHKNRLVHYLERGHLTPADRHLLDAIGPRTSLSAQRRALVQPEEGERYDLKHVRSSSHGLGQWMDRPYFEDRFAAWIPDEEGTVVWTTVKGSGFGVWALEVSETIELMAGLTDVELPIGTLAAPLLNNAPVSSSKCFTCESINKLVIILVLAAVGKDVPYKAVPSPLGSDRRPSDPPMSSSSQVVAPALTSTVPSTRRGVRFAENVDKEDSIPLGYILRHQKRREEKTLFLQREKERREHEEEKLRHEAERQQWEQEKRQWHKEKRTVEEGKRQKQFAEEIAAARVRRELHYALPSSQAREQDRKPREAYTRPTYDPRRQIESPSQTRPPHSRNDSSSSSIQGSLPQSESAGPLASHPGSTYSVVSSEDIRTRASRNSRRGSVVSESTQRSIASPVYTYGWPPVPPVPPLPQVFPIPVYPSVQAMPIMQFPLDMPLLPPTAPFMRQQYSRPPSPRNTSGSRGAGQSRSAERPRPPNDRTLLPSNHRRSSSDDYGGHKPLPRSHSQTNTSSTVHRPPSRHTHSSDASHRMSITASPMYQKPYPTRRQTAIS